MSEKLRGMLTVRLSEVMEYLAGGSCLDLVSTLSAAFRLSISMGWNSDGLERAATARSIR